MQPLSAAHPICAVPPSDSPESPAVPRFGVRLAGVPVLFEPGETLEYVVGPAVHPMPLAPARVRGLMQLRGHPLAVFDAAADAVATAAPDVLVVGPPQRAAGLAVAGPPQQVRLVESTTGEQPPEAAPTPPPPTEQCFSDALGTPSADEDGVWWWPVRSATLFEALARFDASPAPA